LLPKAASEGRAISARPAEDPERIIRAVEFFDNMFSGANFRPCASGRIKPADFKAGHFDMLFLVVA
jgi:hypothetical protein